MRYAEVVVNHRLSRHPVTRSVPPEGDAGPDPRGLTFFYHLPPVLEQQLEPGHLVRVSFGRRWVQAVVLALTKTTPVQKTKPIDTILDPQPVLSPAQIALARWMSEYYVAPLMDCVQPMLPPGISRTSIVLIELGPDRPFSEHLTPKERAVWERVRRDEPIPLDKLTRDGSKHEVKRLLDRGVLIQRYGLKAPRTRPKTQRVARLIVEPDDVVFAELSRAPIQATIVELLAEEGPLPASEIYAAVGGSSATLRTLEDKEIIVLEDQEVWRDPLAGKTFTPDEPPVLTPDQQAAWDTIRSSILNPQSSILNPQFLLHGVTGSGKTEIYLRAIAETLSQGRQAIVMVPEISLTPQTVQRFAARFPGRVTVMHSALSLGERYDSWRRARAGDVDVVIGSRSAVFVPLRRLGLIVIDEEHEWSYKQESNPRYHARDVALRRAGLEDAGVILGSATPSLESYFRTQQRHYRLVEMPHRVPVHPGPADTPPANSRSAGQPAKSGAATDPGPCPAPSTATGLSLGPEPHAEGTLKGSDPGLPPVHVIDLRQELRAGNRNIFSRALQQALTETLDAGHQAILFLNRRGAATFVMCRDCGHVLHCRRCQAPLTYHATEAGLMCHHCNQREMMPQLCPVCASLNIRYFGIGTQRVEATVHQMFPEARVIRWDQDTTRRKGAHEHFLQRFLDGQADILVGTQMIAKGLDLPRVTLVGVVAAETGLHLPDFRAAERTFQLLTQVAGRAGRSSLGGQVIIQTYDPNHYAIQAASRHSYANFYKYELAFRREHAYPPFRKLVKLLYSDSNAEKAQAEAERLAGVLANTIARLGLPETTLIGPAPAFLQRLRGQTRWQILIRTPDPHPLLAGLRLPLGWRVDVDPVNLL
jgi:primosomal protein N' (replication factor Y)